MRQKCRYRFNPLNIVYVQRNPSSHARVRQLGAGALLVMVVNDLGAETDERFEYSSPHESFEVFVAPDEKQDEVDVIADALAFVDDLATRHNEPLRLYQRDFQRATII